MLKSAEYSVFLTAGVGSSHRDQGLGKGKKVDAWVGGWIDGWMDGWVLVLISYYFSCPSVDIPHHCALCHIHPSSLPRVIHNAVGPRIKC